MAGQIHHRNKYVLKHLFMYLYYVWSVYVHNPTDEEMLDGTTRHTKIGLPLFCTYDVTCITARISVGLCKETFMQPMHQMKLFVKGLAAIQLSTVLKLFGTTYLGTYSSRECCYTSASTDLFWLPILLGQCL
jgi:hypothetical protein